MARMDNCSGDEWSLVIAPAGAYLCCFDHESQVSPFCRDPIEVWPDFVNDLPEGLRREALDPAWQRQGIPLITASLWWQLDDDELETSVLKTLMGVTRGLAFFACPGARSTSRR